MVLTKSEFIICLKYSNDGEKQNYFKSEANNFFENNKKKNLVKNISNMLYWLMNIFCLNLLNDFHKLKSESDLFDQISRAGHAILPLWRNGLASAVRGERRLGS